MLYTKLSLNGDWEMDYNQAAYTSKAVPEELEMTLVKDAVPGYWEDMTDKFLYTPFFRDMRINPEYGLWQYPMSGCAPDLALPNVLGNFFYQRKFNWKTTEKPAVLHFDGVQNAVSVWLNDVFVERYEGYSTPFDILLPAKLLKNGKNKLLLSVSNHAIKGFMGEVISGITNRAANEGTGGITGDVEIRTYLSPLREAVLFVSQDLKRVDVRIDSVKKAEYSWAVYDGAKLMKKGTSEGDFSFDTDGLSYWSPDVPKQYMLKISCQGATLERKFGVRRMTVDGVHLRLNGEPCFLRGVCEHCWFPITVHPDHDAKYYREIVRKLKSLGFNFIRFHTYVPAEEYMQAADDLGMILHIECPNNTTVEEYKKIVDFARRHPSALIFCCGNELLLDELFIAHVKQCGDYVHENTDALFSPLSALRGLEYFWLEPGIIEHTETKPFRHHPERFKVLGEFSDLYSSYTLGQTSYISLDGDVKKLDKWSEVYNKPRVLHEICIDGTFTDLRVKDRYKGTRVEKSDMFTSIERHLEQKGVLAKAPLYFRNSSEWQRRIRKNCFEVVRRCRNMAGYDFLGPIDTHWHTFGYDVGMMNEFYELKPGETERNVLMYNSDTVITTDLGTNFNFKSGDNLKFGVYVSLYGVKRADDALLSIRLMLDGRIIEKRNIPVSAVVGDVTKVYDFSAILPVVENPGQMKLYASLEVDGKFFENEWELYLFPETKPVKQGNIVISDGMKEKELIELLEKGKDVVIFGTKPFVSLPTSFRISLAGRTSGNVATVIADHPLMNRLPHEGFCGWQFRDLMDKGEAVCIESDGGEVPFDPVIEVVTTHKFIIRQAAMFEYKALKGRLFVCGFNFKDKDPAAKWLRNAIISYVKSPEFNPRTAVTRQQLHDLCTVKVQKIADDTNLALNPNDKTAIRKKKDEDEQ